MEESSKGKITSFFQSLPKGAPRLPIRLTSTAEPPKIRTKRGPGRPKKVHEPEVIEFDPEETCETVTCTNGEYLSNCWIPDPVVNVVATYAALHSMYVGTSGHL